MAFSRTYTRCLSWLSCEDVFCNLNTWQPHAGRIVCITSTIKPTKRNGEDERSSPSESPLAFRVGDPPDDDNMLYQSANSSREVADSCQDTKSKFLFVSGKEL
ncbi:hypothetical protein MUK42_34867 [Musa troglodytarum]|uniref:Uncharacterized protein n=1 Tax=Musa troglodytarum TaxID=320322 RepID=A0A9E7FFN1_9LILI|nr:hypothetical protein MUK42_34867 [Musa troglodytarum]